MDGRSQAHAVSRSHGATCCGRAMPGSLGYASAGVMADFVMANMVAQAALRRQIAGRRRRRGAEARRAVLQSCEAQDRALAPAACRTSAGVVNGRVSIAIATRKQAHPTSLARAARQPHGVVGAVHAAGGVDAAAVPHLPARPRHLDGLHRTRGSAAPASASGWRTTFSLFDDDVFRLSVFNTIVLHGRGDRSLKFGLGLWLALLLNNAMPFKAFIRAIVLLPYIVPTVLSAIAFWWIYDPQFSIVSWSLLTGGADRPVTSISSASPGTRAGR